MYGSAVWCSAVSSDIEIRAHSRAHVTVTSIQWPDCDNLMGQEEESIAAGKYRTVRRVGEVRSASQRKGGDHRVISQCSHSRSTSGRLPHPATRAASQPASSHQVKLDGATGYIPAKSSDLTTPGLITRDGRSQSSSKFKTESERVPDVAVSVTVCNTSLQSSVPVCLTTAMVSLSSRCREWT